jgi:hypothetical protein
VLSNPDFLNDFKSNKGVDLQAKTATTLALNGGLDESFF